jgi:hypothetical protein
MKKVWCFAPQEGGDKITPDKIKAIVAQVEAHERKQAWYPRYKLQVRFKNQFCYLDGIKEGFEPFAIGRLRFFNRLGWSLAFYAYSSETYRPCVFSDGNQFGKIEDAIDICAGYFD